MVDNAMKVAKVVFASDDEDVVVVLGFEVF